MLSGCTVTLDIKETELGSSEQEILSSAIENTFVVLELRCSWKCVPTTISSGVNISEVNGSSHTSL